MNNSFFFSNQLGIACASDTDRSIFQLSKNEPVALAVCPRSPIPWENLIFDYLKNGEPTHHKTLPEYAVDFESFLQNFPADKTWQKLDFQTANIIFLGYGTDDIYPSACNIQIYIDDISHNIKLGETQISRISIDNTAYFNFNGDFERLKPILYGATKQTRAKFIENQITLFNAYKQRVLDKFNGTKYEQFVKERFDNFDYLAIIPEIIDDATSNMVNKVHSGMATFSIEEMVSYTETLINANNRLKHLHDNGDGFAETTKEIAVLTRAEGFTWIKHSLFAI